MGTYNTTLTSEEEAVAQRLCNEGAGSTEVDNDGQLIPLSILELLNWKFIDYLRQKGIMHLKTDKDSLTKEEVADTLARRD